MISKKKSDDNEVRKGKNGKGNANISIQVSVLFFSAQHFY